MISIIVPTYKEVENLKPLSEMIQTALKDRDYEIIIMDDNSQDGSAELCAELAASHPIRIITRTEDRGLSPAVIDGFDNAKGDYIVVMDADLSHPASAIPKMIDQLQSGESDFVLGSRYVAGGSIDESWTLWRYINSAVATLPALPLTRVKDPMSGFFAVRKADIPPRKDLSPIGYKIALEVMVKGDFKKVSEVPIHFVDRVHGESKLTLAEQLKYLRHLRRLYQHKFKTKAEFFQFALVGSSGFIVDLVVYLLLQTLGLSHTVARAISFWPAASWNWMLNRIMTFNHREKTNKKVQWTAFVSSSLLGFSVNYGTYYTLTTYVPFFEQHMIFALIIGVLMGMGFNFTISNLFIFKKLRDEISEESDKR
ncbi:glycosyltransferase family 2 protein [Thiomicrorhabdus sp. ZW0627]|uniref:glycosyltransferase family 2 protein n=1 Tax=Thiomicrorhabdus sp. ZW0627 TaxID=3039774 RepID=UPI002436D17C|nr:glycosyltransferase family 2 protein [Thiomicrorhabdus sp. ZW0627]MDG6773948.1 glycosyltransferase family 2 protein [Thiomicrorhabdus sp. ZW0627]